MSIMILNLKGWFEEQMKESPYHSPGSEPAIPCSGGPQAPCPAGRTLASPPQGPSAHPALSSIILGNETHTPSPDLLEAGLCSFLGRAMPCAQPHPQSPAWTASLQFFQIFLPSGVSKFKTSPWDLQGKSSHCPGFRVGPLRAFVY